MKDKKQKETKAAQNIAKTLNNRVKKLLIKPKPKKKTVFDTLPDGFE